MLTFCKIQAIANKLLFFAAVLTLQTYTVGWLSWQEKVEKTPKAINLFENVTWSRVPPTSTKTCFIVKVPATCGFVRGACWTTKREKNMWVMKCRWRADATKSSIRLSLSLDHFPGMRISTLLSLPVRRRVSSICWPRAAGVLFF